MTLKELGWNDFFEAQAAEALEQGMRPARVIRMDRGWLVLAADDGILRAPQPRAMTGGVVAVGDWVMITERSATWVVDRVLPRRGALTRRRPGTETGMQVVAANVDMVLIVEGLDRGPNRRRIERAVALSWEAGATPVIVLTKADLCDDGPAAVELASSGAPFAQVVVTSTCGDEGVEALAELLQPGTTGVMLGPSGAGKSTLVNALVGGERMATGAVRVGDNKGRHTTTHRELVRLPSGAMLIDTPGVRELGVSIEPEAMADAFSDVVELAAACRFRDCRHDSEPGCAVREAEEAGRLEPGRRAGYRKLEHEAEELERRRDPQKAHETRALDRSLAKLIRAEVKRKGDK